MAKHKFTREERVRGGKTRKQQASYPDACRKGFAVTLERYPFFARKWLKKQIRADYPQGRVYTTWKEDC